MNQNSQYSIKTEIYAHEEDDPNYKCKTYTTGTSFESCLRNDFVRKLVGLVNCFPPWLANEDEEPICKGHLNISVAKYNAKNMEIGLGILVDQETHCPAPCTANVYRSQLDYQVARTHHFQGTTSILFEKHAIVHKASFSIGHITLLSRIGGYISGGRTLFWMIVGGCGLLKSVLFFFKNIKN